MENLTRKEFLKKCLSVTIIATVPSFLRDKDLFAQYTYGKYLTAVKNGSPSALFKKGMSNFPPIERLSIKNKKILIKPNIGWDKSPESGANTHPDIVKEAVLFFIEKGASKVYVMDHTCNQWEKSYKNSGIEYAAKNAGAIMAPAHRESYYQASRISGASKLKSTKIHELVFESDIFVNIPVLKTHHSANMTSAMKNLMGVIWDRFYLHRHDLNQSIADLSRLVKPDINIVDAYRMMHKNGPRGYSKSDTIIKKQLFISNDIVAIDSASAKTLGINPESLRYLKAADGISGNINLNKISIKRFSI